ncbi:MAG TPA: O-antigen ligase family protein [Chthoniobacterales bacterium]|nr:O-antigen ligase family protein [Chthoniobacterales bacterium]
MPATKQAYLVPPTLGAVIHPAPISRRRQTVYLILLCLGFAVISALIGGTRLVFSLPAYGLLGVLAVLALVSVTVVRPAPSHLCLLSAALFFGYLLGRAWLSPVVYLAREDAFAVLGSLLVYFTVACALTDTSRRFVFIFFLLALAIVQTVVGAIQFKNGDNFMAIPFLQRFDYGSRASGFYVCPNHFAGFLEVVGLFGLGAICWGRWPRWGRIVLIYLVGVCYLALGLTMSRAGYLSATFGLLVFATVSLIVLFRAGTKRFWKTALGVIVGAIALAFIATFLANKSFYLSTRAHSAVQDTDNVRFDLWEAALTQAKLNPIWGTGSGTYLYYGREFRSERVQADPVDAHNDYLHLLAEYGWAGVGAFVIFLGVHVYRSWQNVRRLGPRRGRASPRLRSNRLALQISALAVIATYVVHSAFDFNLHIPVNAMALAFVFALVTNPGLERDEATGWLGRGSLIFWRLALAGIGGFMVFQAIKLSPSEYFAERSRTALRDEQFNQAADYALKGLATDHQNPNLYYYLARARIAEGNQATDEARSTALFQSAMVAVEKARDLAPRDVYFTVEIALINDALGRFSQAESAFQKAMQLDPKSIRLKEDYETHRKEWRESEAEYAPDQ